MNLKSLIDKIEYRFALTNSNRYVKYLRKCGMRIGEGTIVCSPKNFEIDFSRPHLITIGDNVRLNAFMTIMCHDAATKVFRSIKGEIVPSNGRVTIGNNVYFGRHTTVLKGVTIGDNCIIGYGSTVMKDIPSNSVAVGTPAKVICTIDEYYEKRQLKALEESFENARAIQERYNRRPVPEDFFESFVYFVNGDEAAKYPKIPIEYQLGPGYETWVKNHKALFNGFDDFLKAAGIE